MGRNGKEQSPRIRRIRSFKEQRRKRNKSREANGKRKAYVPIFMSLKEVRRLREIRPTYPSYPINKRGILPPRKDDGLPMMDYSAWQLFRRTRRGKNNEDTP